jgi:ech hydrogenase subunit A
MLWLAFFWEVTTLCCWGLIRHDLTDIAKTNALRALWMCLIGSTAITAAIILIWNSPLATISLLDMIQNNINFVPALYLPLAFLSVAAFTKSAQVPFQGWLLGAKGEWPPHRFQALLHLTAAMDKSARCLFYWLLAAAFGGISGSSLYPTFIAVFGGMGSS